MQESMPCGTSPEKKRLKDVAIMLIQKTTWPSHGFQFRGHLLNHSLLVKKSLKNLKGHVKYWWRFKVLSQSSINILMHYCHFSNEALIKKILNLLQ